MTVFVRSGFPRLLAASLLALGALGSLAHCGDDDDETRPPAAGSGGAAGQATGGAAGQATGGAGGAGGGAAGAGDCGALRRAVDEALATAQACALGADALLCDDVVEGVCCQAVIADAASDAGRAYAAALAAFRGAGCSGNCEAVRCASFTTGECAEQGGRGVCRGK